MKYFNVTASFLFVILLLTSNSYAQKSEVSLNLMPWPASVKLAGGKYRLDQKFTVSITGNPGTNLYSAASRMLRRLSDRTGLFFSQDYLSADSVAKSPAMFIHAGQPGKLKLFVDESYELVVTPTQIRLNANTSIGALRGIETFLQLLAADNSGYYFPAVTINDKPRFPWRGLLIDVSRHFMPVNVIKRNLDGMAALKMNVLHWHLSDDQGFRVECKTLPKLVGMGSDGLFYSQSQIKDVIQYASERGISVMPEFDLPAHSTSWFVGYPQYASAPGHYSIERKWGIFDPVFDPTNSKTYVFLDKFFKEVCSLFPNQFIDIGGDENNGKQWNANPKIKQFMKTHNIPDDRALQTYFENHLIPILTKYKKNIVGWEEILNPALPKTAIVQSWRGSQSLEQAASEGYKVILSRGYYLDNYRLASDYYLTDPVPDSLKLTDPQKKLVIGGEAAMWAEYVTHENIDSRIWPRNAAVAERLWSSKNVKNVKDMYRRLKAVSFELEGLGLTQKKNQLMMLSRLANGYSIKPLLNFINVVSPVDLYSRVKSRTYTSYSPLTRAVDAAIPDPEAARDFNYSVDRLLADNASDKNSVNVIRKKLTAWKNNDSKMEWLIARSPILKEIQPVSKHLSELASIGLQALHYIETGAKPDDDWMKESILTIDQAAQPGGEIKLTIFSSIKKMVEYAGGNNRY